MPKYVVSLTVHDPAWTNSTVLKGDVASEVSTLKQQLGKEVVVYGSAQLVHLLRDRDLVDELRLTVYPIVLGAGQRLFGQTSDTKPMRLINTQPVGSDLAYLTYELTSGA
jgi:dihydrofolate reductase